MCDKLNGCLLRYSVLCFKGFFIKKFQIYFCMWWCFTLPAEPAAYIPVINVPQGILTLSEGQYSLHKDHRSSNDAKNHPYTSALHFGFSVSLLSLLNANMNKVHLCCHTMKIALTPSPFFGLQMIIFLRYNTAVSTISIVSPPVDHTQLHFLRLPVVVYAFISSLSSLTSSPSSPSRRRLGRLCLRHYLVAGFAFTLHVGSSAWIVALVLFYFALDRPQWPSPQGALGNAPLGTSLCRCGGGFPRVCIPCNGFRRRVSPDLSSDKSHLVRDPFDVMRSYRSLSNLRVAWPGSQRVNLVKYKLDYLFSQPVSLEVQPSQEYLFQ
ncbi:hypothetical protein OUZ56_002369 [Daphnia magna]|uniref:Uncharacterized protein n=1 Tax=Daphnia magna TaxID=35525 RepID=A0ABR0A5G7_9CRUS|nr:hypothetical protein OUZ56_002369 [Daphnia magna]